MPEAISQANQVEFLKHELQTEMESFDRNATKNRIAARRLMVGGAICSTLTTILLGLQGLPDGSTPYIKDAALIFSACVTILSAFNAFYNHRQLWIRYTVTWAAFRSIQKDLTFLLASNPSDKDKQLNELYRRFKTTLDEADASWLEIRRDNSANAS